MSVLRDRRLAPHRDRLVLGRIRHPEVLVDPDLTGQVQRVADPNTIAEGERSGLRGAPWRHVGAPAPAIRSPGNRSATAGSGAPLLERGELIDPLYGSDVRQKHPDAVAARVVTMIQPVPAQVSHGMQRRCPRIGEHGDEPTDPRGSRTHAPPRVPRPGWQLWMSRHCRDLPDTESTSPDFRSRDGALW
jgi:hypothetical protein